MESRERTALVTSVIILLCRTVRYYLSFWFSLHFDRSQRYLLFFNFFLLRTFCTALSISRPMRVAVTAADPSSPLVSGDWYQTKSADAPAEHVCGCLDCHCSFPHCRISYAQCVQPTAKTVLLLQRQAVPQQSHQVRTPTRRAVSTVTPTSTLVLHTSRYPHAVAYLPPV